MSKVYYHRLIDVQEFDIDPKEDIMQQIFNINAENSYDKNRFLLYVISPSILANYNLSDPNSSNEFVNKYDVRRPFFKMIGGGNYDPNVLKRGIRYAGIRLSDPNEKIMGQFVRIGKKMTYCPFFPPFEQEYDLCKFANNIFFTSLPFKEIFLNQIEYAKRYYINAGETISLEDYKKYGDYLIERISKEQMIEYATKPSLQDEILSRRLEYRKSSMHPKSS